MTATITPAGDAVALAVQDPVARQRQYEEALVFYAEHLGGALDGIVIAENSGADLEPFKRLKPGDPRLELVSVPATPAGEFLGRGYPETLLVSDALRLSVLLRDAPMVKVTGRYQVRNLRRVLRAMDFSQDCGFSSRRVPAPWVDLGVYFASRPVLEFMRERADRLIEGPERHSPERSMVSILDELEAADFKVQRRYRAEPRIRGVRGWDGRAYGDWRQTAKWASRSAAKLLVPRLWI